MRRLLLLVALFPATLAAQTRIPGAVRVDSVHAETFRADYARVLACTGLRRPFEAVTWFIVPGGSFRDPVQESYGEQKVRYWGETVLRAAADTIFLAEVRPEWVVRHELIHYVRNSIDHDEWMNHRCEAPLSQRILDDESRVTRGQTANARQV